MAPSAELISSQKKSIEKEHGVPRRVYSFDKKPSIEDFIALTNQVVLSSTYPLAAEIISNIPVYDLSKFDASDIGVTSGLMDEWNHILLSGPGVYILRNFSPDGPIIDKVNDVFQDIIHTEKATAKGDHFATSGSNSRIWNSYQKHAEKDPTTFIKYYSNPWLSMAAEAWLGPAYQITAQVNVVHPGGKPQMPHRDYHIGFQTAEASANYPKAVHVASQFLTLQGAIAHSNMSLESGPTRFLPFTQQFEEGFMAYRLPEFHDYFENHWVSAPLTLGDAVFFNPTLFHAAGENRTVDVKRSANLLQISSSFGKTMETIDTLAIIASCWPYVVALYREEGFSNHVDSAIKSIGDGYPFPTNLDHRTPTSSGMAPESEQDMLRRALEQNWTVEQVINAAKQIRHDSLP